MNPDLETYLLSHIDAEGDYLYRLYRATNIHTCLLYTSDAADDSTEV